MPWIGILALITTACDSRHGVSVKCDSWESEVDDMSEISQQASDLQ